MDANGWLIGFALNFALLMCFGVSLLLAGTPAGGFARYADSAILLVLSACLAPVPIRGIARALRDVVQIAPRDLDETVRRVMDALIAEHGFTIYASYVTRMGRGRFVEIHLVLPPELKLENAAKLDRYREEILAGLGEGQPAALAHGGLHRRSALDLSFDSNPRSSLFTMRRF